MTGEPPVVVAIEIGEPQLADRLAALLADVPGLGLPRPASLPMRSWPSRASRLRRLTSP